jgi:hypothetical protein
LLQDLVVQPVSGECCPLPPLAKLVHHQDGLQCRGGGYSNLAGREGWEEWAMFYSEECRIRNECDRFFWRILGRSMLICIYLDDRDLYDKLFILLNTMIHSVHAYSSKKRDFSVKWWGAFERCLGNHNRPARPHRGLPREWSHVSLRWVIHIVCNIQDQVPQCNYGRMIHPH